MLRSFFGKRINEIHEKYKDKDLLIIDNSDNFLRQELLGLGKIRGNGVILLTGEELYFRMWKPKKRVNNSS